MKSLLLWKLVALQMLVVGAVVAMVAYAVHTLAAAHFMALIDKYEVPKDAAYGMYLDAVDRHLIMAASLGGLLAISLSILVTRQTLKPLAELSGVAKKIAEGDYTSRVRQPRRGDFASVAAAFNSMAESLQRTDDLRKSLVSNAAHELRTPLTNIRGYLEALRDNVLSASAETFQILHDESLRLVQLVDDLIRLARADAAKADVGVEKVRVDRLVLHTVKLFVFRFKQKKIRVTAKMETLRNPILGDRRKLAQILTNLVDNACRYTPAEGKVSIHTHRSADRIKIAVTNTCGSIDPDELPRLFERFYRRDKSRSRETGGAGIGLAIVKELVEAQGGQVGIAHRDGRLSIWFTIPTAGAELPAPHTNGAIAV